MNLVHWHLYMSSHLNEWIGLHLFNDHTRPSGHISRPAHLNELRGQETWESILINWTINHIPGKYQINTNKHISVQFTLNIKCAQFISMCSTGHQQYNVNNPYESSIYNYPTHTHRNKSTICSIIHNLDVCINLLVADTLKCTQTSSSWAQDAVATIQPVMGVSVLHSPPDQHACRGTEWLERQTNPAWLHLTGLILGLHPANETQCYFVTTSLIGWAQA